MKPLRLALIVAFVGLGAVGGVAAWKEFATPAKWRTVGGLGDQKTHRFVEINPAHAKQRATYDEAVKALCKDRPNVSVCMIGFFLPGDTLPAKQPTAAFFKAGGWANYTPLAVYSQNERTGVADFIQWDCARAGDDGAPLAALCGPGVKEAHAAVVTLASRAGMAEPCGWPKTQDAAFTSQYIAALPDPARQAQFKEAFERSYVGGQKAGENRPNCPKLRPKVDADADAARRTLGFKTAVAQSDAPAKEGRKGRAAPERPRGGEPAR